VPSKKKPHPAAPHSGPASGPKSAFASATGTVAPPRPAITVPSLPALESEWLEVDGLGGFASGTVSGIRTRRTHALLLTSTPSGAIALVNGIDARVTTPHGTFDLTSHRYAPDVVHPEGHRYLESFTCDPWPTWLYHLEDGTHIEQQLFCVSGAAGTILTWNVIAGSPAGVSLTVRPLLSGREAHALHHENHFRSLEALCSDYSVQWHPYPSLPAIVAGSNGSYAHLPFWYRNFLYAEDRARGWDHTEDLHSPGAFRFNLARGEAVLVLTTEEGLRALESTASAHVAGLPGFVGPTRGDPEGALDALREGERAVRNAFPSPLHRAADAYLVRQGHGLAVVSGYPAAHPSARETFAAVRGLCLATGRRDEARRVLLSWIPDLSGGLFPSSPPANGEEPVYDSVDAPLWFILAAHELMGASHGGRRGLPAGERKALLAATEAILTAYVEGTRHRIRMDEDGLLASGEVDLPGLTWMDAALADTGAAPRIGKAVEVQALWLNALRVAGETSPPWRELYERGLGSFQRRFWNEAAGCLYDVVDANHERGVSDAAIRPNQILAVGGLPVPPLDGKRARQVVDVVEYRLGLPGGLRAGPPDDGSAPKVAWPWLLGPFVDAWVRVRGGTPEAIAEARAKFLEPMLARLGNGGLGHLPEALDGNPPHADRGASFCAWSMGEAIRLDQELTPST